MKKINPLKGKKQSIEHIEKRRLILTGRTQSEKHRQKNSELRKREWKDPVYRARMIKSFQGRVQSEESNRKRSIALKGRVFTDEEKKKISEGAKKVWLNSEYKKRFSKSRTGKKNPNWKLHGLAYGTIHDRIRNTYGTPCICDRCGTTTAKRYDWANISRKYLLDRKDWLRLCRSCHVKMDRKLMRDSGTIFWKENAGDSAITAWIIARYGKAQKCLKCNSEKNVCWVKKTSIPSRDINDYLQMCRGCMSKYYKTASNFKGD